MNGKLVTFGIVPNSPETGYGYIESEIPFKKNQIIPGTQASAWPNQGMPSNGDNHPPKNAILATADTMIMAMYSAKKNTAKVMPEYST